MKVPKKRSEFERNLYILSEAVRKNPRTIGRDHKSLTSFESVRAVPNHRIDLLTISERVRLSANMSANRDLFFSKFNVSHRDATKCGSASHAYFFLLTI